MPRESKWSPERLEKMCIALCIVARELEEIRERELAGLEIGNNGESISEESEDRS